MAHRFRVLSFAVLLLAASVACKDKPPPVPAGMPSATGSSQAEPPAVVRHRQLAYCPSAVTGASTEIRDGNGNFDVVVTAPTEAAVQEIRERSKHLALIAIQDTVSHKGVGMGNAALEECPSLIINTTPTETDIDGGASITLTPTNPVALLALRRHSYFLAKKLAPPAPTPAP